MISGLFLTGTPAIDLTPDSFKAGFRPFPGIELISKDHFTNEEALKFVSLLKPSYEAFMIEDAERAHGQARSLMIAQALSGEGRSQKEIIENTLVPLAFVLGTADEGINGEYIKSLLYKKELQIHELPVDHDTFWSTSEAFNEAHSTPKCNADKNRSVKEDFLWCFII